VRRTFGALLAFAREGTLFDDGMTMLHGIGWAIRERKRVPCRVLSMLREVERHERRSASTPFASPPPPARAAPSDQSDQSDQSRERHYEESL